MRIGSTTNQLPHLSISSSRKSVNGNENIPKYKKENISKKQDSSQDNVSHTFKRNDPIKDLMEQKQKIADNKNKYLEDAFKKNESSDTIKQKLAEYDKQISEIDKQITQIKLEEQTKRIGTNDKDKKDDNIKDNSTTNNTQDNSSQKSSDKMMNNLVNLSNNLSVAKKLSVSKTSQLGEIKVLEGEIKLDEGRSVPSNTSSKKTYVAKLKYNIERIEKNIGDKLNPNTSNDNLNSKVNNNHTENFSVQNKEDNIKDSKMLQSIKNYIDNIEHNTTANGQKINSVA